MSLRLRRFARNGTSDLSSRFFRQIVQNNRMQQAIVRFLNFFIRFISSSFLSNFFMKIKKSNLRFPGLIGVQFCLNSGDDLYGRDHHVYYRLLWVKFKYQNFIFWPNTFFFQTAVLILNFNFDLWISCFSIRLNLESLSYCGANQNLKIWIYYGRNSNSEFLKLAS